MARHLTAAATLMAQLRRKGQEKQSNVRPTIRATALHSETHRENKTIVDAKPKAWFTFCAKLKIEIEKEKKSSHFPSLKQSVVYIRYVCSPLCTYSFTRKFPFWLLLVWVTYSFWIWISYPKSPCKWGHFEGAPPILRILLAIWVEGIFSKRFGSFQRGTLSLCKSKDCKAAVHRTLIPSSWT